MREYGDEYADPIPPYGEAPTPPSLFAAYGEYADAFRLTADVRVEGRSGMGGAEDEVAEDDKDEACGAAVETPVDAAIAR